MLWPRLDLGRLVVVAKDPAVERGHGDIDAGRPEIGHEDVPGVGAERQLAWWPPARARAAVPLRDQTPVHQLADTLGDDRPAKASVSDEFRSGAGLAQADRVEDSNQGVKCFVRERPGGSGIHRRMILSARSLAGRLLHLT